MRSVMRDYGASTDFFDLEPSTGPLRPHFPDALSLDDIVPGLVVRRHNKEHGSYPNTETILSEPFRDERGNWRVKTDRYERASLGDMGVAPYISTLGELWNLFNWTTKVEEAA